VQLERVFAETRDASTAVAAEPRMDQSASLSAVDTAVDQDVLDRIGKAHVELPEGFTPHPKLAPLLERRVAMVRDGGIELGSDPGERKDSSDAEPAKVAELQ